MKRREFLRKIAMFFAWFLAGEKVPFNKKLLKSLQKQQIPARFLGKTGVKVSSFGLGGEGILRSSWRKKNALPVIQQALDLGVTYFDTAPAYAQSQDYLGEGLQGKRDEIFIASKTHLRTRDSSLRLLEDSLKRLRTDHLDLWQLHDLRNMEDLNTIFSNKGALKAAQEARSQGLIRFIGITGHYDPQILLEAMKRFSFDTVMCAVNAGDKYYRSFQDTVISDAVKRNMGIIAMKVLARGNIFRPTGIKTPREAIHYVLSLPVSVTIIGCKTPKEVEENVAIAKLFRKLSTEEMRELEELVKFYQPDLNFYKK